MYVQLAEQLFKGEIDYISKVAKTENEALFLVKAGFEFVYDFDWHKLFKKENTNNIGFITQTKTPVFFP
jgi:hypothetical protein